MDDQNRNKNAAQRVAAGYETSTMTDSEGHRLEGLVKLQDPQARAKLRRGERRSAASR